MKKKEKRMILILIVIGIILVGIIYFATRPGEEELKTGETNNSENKVVEEFVQVMEDGSKINTSTKLNETKKVNGLEIGNITLSTVNGETTLIADVKNNSGRDVGVKPVDITLYDKNNTEIVTIEGVIGNVKAGETVKLEASTTLDFANAYDFKVVIK